MGEVPDRCEVCQGFEKAPHAPAAGTSSVAMFNEKLQADLLFLDGIISVAAMDVVSKFPLLIPGRTKGPKDAWDALCSSRIEVLGAPMIIQLDEGRERTNELRVELRPERRIKLLFQGVGAHHMDP